MEQLYKTYEHSLTVQGEALESARARLKNAIAHGKRSEIQHLKSLVRVLYEEKWELEERKREIGSYLAASSSSQ